MKKETATTYIGKSRQISPIRTRRNNQALPYNSMLLCHLNLHCFSHTMMNESATVISRGYKSCHSCLKLAGWSFLHALVSVVHSDWLTGSNFRLRASDNLHTDARQNLWTSTRKKEDIETDNCYRWILPPQKFRPKVTLIYYLSKKESSPANKSHKLS